MGRLGVGVTLSMLRQSSPGSYFVVMSERLHRYLPLFEGTVNVECAACIKQLASALQLAGDWFSSLQHRRLLSEEQHTPPTCYDELLQVNW